MPDNEPNKPTHPNWAKHEAKLIPPDVKPPRVRSLAEQLHEEWVRLAQKDGRLTEEIKRRHEAQFTVTKADSNIRLRLKFLQAKAVEKIQKRNGVRNIPGHRLPGTSTKEETKKMFDQLRRLATYHGFELPSDFSPDTPQLNEAIDVTPQANEQSATPAQTPE